MITDGITVNNLHSFQDFGLWISEKNIGLPSKRSIRDSVPYMNGYYDFTAMEGAPTWLSRELTYKFDVLEETEQAMNRKRDAIINWLLNIHEAEIYDDTMPDYHFHGSYEDGEQTDESEKSEITVKFICYPFRIANHETAIALQSGDNVIENAGQAVTAYISASAAGSITMGEYTQGFSANTRTELAAMLQHGANAISLTCAGSVTLYYTEEII